MANQRRLKNFRNWPIYKYGIQVPRTHEEAVWLDEKSNTNHWKEAEQLEIEQLFDYASFDDRGKGTPIPEGYNKIPCHFVYDLKYDGRHKARFVTGGHQTDTPIDSVYSGMVSILGI